MEVRSRKMIDSRGGVRFSDGNRGGSACARKRHILVALVTVVPSATRAQSAPGLAAGYAFNEGSGTTAADVSGSGLTGT